MNDQTTWLTNAYPEATKKLRHRSDLLLQIARVLSLRTGAAAVIVSTVMVLVGCGDGSSSSNGIASSTVSYPSPTPPASPGPVRVIPASGKPTHTTWSGDHQTSGTTTISTVTLPVSLVFDELVDARAKHVELDAGPIVPSLVASPIFQNYGFETGNTQYGDAVQRAAFCIPGLRTGGIGSGIRRIGAGKPA